LIQIKVPSPTKVNQTIRLKRVTTVLLVFLPEQVCGSEFPIHQEFGGGHRIGLRGHLDREHMEKQVSGGFQGFSRRPPANGAAKDTKGKSLSNDDGGRAGGGLHLIPLSI